MDFHRVPNQVLYQAEPLPDALEEGTALRRKHTNPVVFAAESP